MNTPKPSKPLPTLRLIRLPRRESLTLCIAAACIENRQPRIVIGSDWRVETSSFGAEIQDKFYWINDSWACLVAGDISRAVELRAAYRQYFEDMGKAKIAITKANIHDIMRQPVRRFKRKLAEELVSRKFGMTYGYFLRHGKSQLPDKKFEDVIDEIEELDLGCQLILCGFSNNQPYIFMVDSDASIEYEEHFAVIGSGTDIAASVLFQREHDESLPLSQGLYHVYEALKLGAKAPGVGSEHAISMLYPSKDKKMEMKNVEAPAWRYLKGLYKKFAPKEFYQLPRLPKKAFK